jgi:CIC family chloride channel protein
MAKKILYSYFKELGSLAYEAVEWTVSGAIIGVTVGILMLAFRIALVKLSAFSEPAFNNIYLTLLLPTLSLFCAGIIINKVPVVGGRGVNFIIKSILHHKMIKIVALPFKFIATLLTLCFGGSGGREGPALQMATYVGDKISQLIKFKTIRREYIVISAVSASFGAMFHAPIAGAVFGCEVLMLRGIKYNPLLTIWAEEPV